MAEEKYRVFFKYSGHYNTEKVELIGNFNNWKAGTHFLEDDDGDNVWHTYIDLPSGIYQYKYLVDGGRYFLDARNPEVVTDERGNQNSLLLVGEAKLKGDVVHTYQDVDAYSGNVLYIKAAMNRSKFLSTSLILVIHDTPRSVPGYLLYHDEVYNYYIFRFENGAVIDNLIYYFEIKHAEGTLVYYGRNGLIRSEWEVENFDYARPAAIPFKTPDWLRDAVFYQIFPDRFCDGNKKTNPPRSAKPDTPPAPDTFYGGDLEGVIKKTGYLADLGVNSVYFNPLFESPSTHKYDTADYKKIDPHFGNDEVFVKMVRTFKENSIRFILDGVFNHCGAEFGPFKDLLKNGEKSRYRKWFFVDRFPLVDPDSGNPNYECWWGFQNLPKLNVENPEVKNYLMNVAAHWIKKGASGWRLDVPNEIDHWFWKEFRKTVKHASEDAYILGEIWTSGTPWLKGDEFDSIMNYRFRDACVEFFALRKCDADYFIKEVARQVYEYPMQANFAVLNLLSSHDTSRFMSVTGSDPVKVKLAAAFQFTFIGAPSIYYGEEAGMEGRKDPDNRRFMVWDEKKWDGGVFQNYKSLIRIRRENEILRRGDIRFIFSKGMAVGFERFIGDQKLLVFINNSEENMNIDVTKYFGNGDFMDISKDYPLKRKRAYTLYGNEYVILKKVKER